MSCLKKAAANTLLAIIGAGIVASGCWTSSAVGQQIAGYRYVERTVYEKRPVTLTKEVQETVIDKKQVSSYKHVWNTEQREKRTTVKKPVTRTTLQEKRTVVKKPVTETKYRERRTQRTTYELNEEMREQEYTVKKPVTETRYRDEQYNVRQKITEDMIEVKNETVYKPKTVQETAYVPSETVVLKTVGTPDPNCRPRMEWLRPGYYTDPTSGQQVWRRRGLHWVQPTVGTQVADTVPTLVATQVQKIQLVPESVTTRRPVKMSRYVDRVESRRVPYTVEKMVEETMIRQVPVTVKKPVTQTVVEKIPYTETRYVDEVVVTKVPVEETTYEEVTTVEPYDVEVSKWVPFTEEVEVPKTVTRRVEYQEMREVPVTIWVKVPVDANGNALGVGTPVSAEEMKNSSRYTAGYGATPRNGVDRYKGTWNTPSAKSPAAKSAALRGAASANPSAGAASVLVPPTEEPSASHPGERLKPIERRPTSAPVDHEREDSQTERGPYRTDQSPPGADRESEADRVPSLEPVDRSTRAPSYYNRDSRDVQDSGQIAGLRVLRRPVVEGDGLPAALPTVPEAGRPEVELNHDRDVLNAEKTF